jgi:hypothetical protein
MASEIFLGDDDDHLVFAHTKVITQGGGPIFPCNCQCPISRSRYHRSLHPRRTPYSRIGHRAFIPTVAHQSTGPSTFRLLCQAPMPPSLRSRLKRYRRLGPPRGEDLREPAAASSSKYCAVSGMRCRRPRKKSRVFASPDTPRLCTTRASEKDIPLNRRILPPANREWYPASFTVLGWSITTSAPFQHHAGCG